MNSLLIHDSGFVYDIIGRHIGPVYDLLPQDLLYLLPPETQTAPGGSLTRIENTWIHNIANYMLLLEYYVHENRQMENSFHLMFRTLEQALHRYTRLHTNLNVYAFGSRTMPAVSAAVREVARDGAPLSAETTPEAVTHYDTQVVAPNAPLPADMQPLVIESSADEATAVIREASASHIGVADAAAASDVAPRTTTIAAQGERTNTMLFRSTAQRDALLRLVERIERRHTTHTQTDVIYASADGSEVSPQTLADTPSQAAVNVMTPPPATLDVLVLTPGDSRETVHDGVPAASEQNTLDLPQHIPHAAMAVQPIVLYRDGRADIRWLTDEQRTLITRTATVVLPSRSRDRQTDVSQPSLAPEPDVGADSMIAPADIVHDTADAGVAAPPQGDVFQSPMPAEAAAAEPPPVTFVTSAAPAAPATLVTPAAPPIARDAPTASPAPAGQRSAAPAAIHPAMPSVAPVSVNLAREAAVPPAAITLSVPPDAESSDYRPERAADIAQPASHRVMQAGYRAADIPSADLHHAAAPLRERQEDTPQAQHDIEFVTRHSVSETTVRETHTKNIAINAPPELMSPLEEAARLQEQEVSLSRITNQVYRRIQQRLNIERQRRGR